MSSTRRYTNPLFRLAVLTCAVVVCLAQPVLAARAVPAARAPASVAGWIRAHAARLATTDPAASLADLAPIRGMVGGARVVGLGESTHGAHEESALKHRVLRFLVERMGVRSVAWEGDWTTSILLDDYLRTGRGDLNALLKGTDWDTREVADVMRWLRRYDARHGDQVRLVGLEFYATRPLAYDAITGYVTRTDPARLPELRRHMRVIRPSTSDMGAYVGWYYGVPDKSPYISHARRLYDLVAHLRHRPGDRAYDLVLHHARQIRSFYEYFDLSAQDGARFRDARAAENLRWWQRRFGGKIAYWAAGAHTANAPGVELSQPPDPTVRYDSVGSYLRRWYGDRYRSIGFTFDSGTVNAISGPPSYTPRPVQVPRPSPGFAERPLGDAGLPQYALDLRVDAPPAVRSWRQAPTRTRVIGGYDPAMPDAYYMTGGSLAQWFDVIVHRQTVTPTHLL